MTYRDVTQQHELKQAKKQNKMTNLMVSSVSHEYLTPVRCIYNLSTILAKKVEGEENQKNIQMI